MATLLFLGRVGCRAYMRSLSTVSRAPLGMASSVTRDDGYLRFVDPRTREVYAHVPAFEAERAKREFGLIPETEWLETQPVNLQLEHW